MPCWGPHQVRQIPIPLASLERRSPEKDTLVKVGWELWTVVVHSTNALQWVLGKNVLSWLVPWGRCSAALVVMSLK